MSDEKKLELKSKPASDMSKSDLEAIAAYIEEGTPGLENIDSASMKKMADAYIEGMTYRQVSSLMRLKKPVILFCADRFGWYAARREYFDDMNLTIKDRLIDAKLENKDFSMQISQFFKKKIGIPMQKFYETGNIDFANMVSNKDVDQYRKWVELLHKLDETGKNPRTGKAPTVGLNLGENGVTVERLENGTVEITPKEKAVTSVVAKYAAFRREQESQKVSRKSEPEELIVEQPPKPEGE